MSGCASRYACSWHELMRMNGPWAIKCEYVCHYQWCDVAHLLAAWASFDASVYVHAEVFPCVSLLCEQADCPVNAEVFHSGIGRLGDGFYSFFWYIEVGHPELVFPSMVCQQDEFTIPYQVLDVLSA